MKVQVQTGIENAWFFQITRTLDFISEEKLDLSMRKQLQKYPNLQKC